MNNYNKIVNFDFSELYKIDRVKKAMDRNSALTSESSLDLRNITYYDNGVYITIEGCRTAVKLFFNKEGILIRKPRKAILINSINYYNDYNINCYM